MNFELEKNRSNSFAMTDKITFLCQRN